MFKRRHSNSPEEMPASSQSSETVSERWLEPASWELPCEEGIGMSRGKVSHDPGDVLCYDPLLARILSLGELPIPHRLNWICNAKSILLRRRDELSAEVIDESSYEAFARDGTLALIAIRIKALDEVYERILDELKQGEVA
jgi:hypothetical protein